MDESHPVIKELGSPGALLEGVFALLDRLEIDASTFEADHVCFRCADASEYHRVVALCENVGVRLVEGMIGGRPISKSSADAHFDLPSQGASQVPRALDQVPRGPRAQAWPQDESGWEHVELVVGGGAGGAGIPRDTAEPLRDLMRKHPSADWDARALDKHLNPDVSLALPGGGGSVKFHALPLDEVVRIEIAEGLVEPVPADYWETLT
eukprot:CAMPEP_0180374566 /NCGR_PEP_ID=MMETSP0989-20121125/22080_1 /TAXON_ID=697907 /ORGANISM="non described non described, Strain CCMP2293" /LENGTH=208 /DNA_ID=CAMNT_0022371983 /DNA_START=172 /DNA_END=800 /DNA_ORIENTATION=+